MLCVNLPAAPLGPCSTYRHLAFALPHRQLRSFCCVAEAARLLTDAGAVSALLVALRRIPDCDPACGAPFGMEDALEQLQAGRLAAA